jgi:cytochrome c oxidase subunit 4
MTEPMISPRTYLVVLVLLLVLTLATVGVSFLPLAAEWHLAGGLAIAVVKAALVVLFFMHVLHASSATRAVVAVSIVGLCLLLGLTLVDYMSRGMVPGMPGH